MATVMVSFRASIAKRDEMDAAAAEWGMSRSDWLTKLVDDELRRMARMPRTRQTTVIPTVAKGRMLVGSVSPRLCNHPRQMRSEKAPDGTSRCLACNQELRPLP